MVQVRQLLGQQCDWRGYWSTSTSPPLPDPIPTLLQLTTYAEANYLSPDESQGVDGLSLSISLPFCVPCFGGD